MEKEYAIGIDLGGTSVKYALIDNEGVFYFQGKLPSKADVSAEAVIGQLVTAINEVKAFAQEQGYKINGIGIGTPGIVDSTNRIVLGGAENINGWENIHLADRIEKETGFPALLGNDANLMGLGETMYGAGQGEMCIRDRFKDAPAWRKSGIDILNREIHVQVYEDGGQFELDPQMCIRDSRKGVGTTADSGRFNMLAQILSARPTGGNKLTDEELLHSAIDPEMLETGESLAQVNPVMQTQSVTNNKRGEMWSGNASVSWQIIQGLTFKSAGTYNTTNSLSLIHI